MASERPRRRMFEQWHPLGTIGVISAFNFPVAVWAWNAMLAAVCGDPVLWKPSSQTPVSAIAGPRTCPHGRAGAGVVVGDAGGGVGARAVLLGAVGPSGQRGTTVRRMVVESGIKGDVLK